MLVSLYFLFYGAYITVYAKTFLTAVGLTQCFGEQCLKIGFLSLLGWILVGIGLVYIITAVLLRFHKLGCYTAMVISLFSILLIIAYSLKPDLTALWLIFIFPVKLATTTAANLPVIGGLLQIFVSLTETLTILVNLIIFIYLLILFGKGIWNEKIEISKEIEELEEENSRA